MSDYVISKEDKDIMMGLCEVLTKALEDNNKDLIVIPEKHKYSVLLYTNDESENGIIISYRMDSSIMIGNDDETIRITKEEQPELYKALNTLYSTAIRIYQKRKIDTINDNLKILANSLTDASK